jgi:hypothetical protein
VLISVVDWIGRGIAAASPWQWIERASWMVAIFGLPIGIYQVAAPSARAEACRPGAVAQAEHTHRFLPDHWRAREEGDAAAG